MRQHGVALLASAGCVEAELPRVLARAMRGGGGGPVLLVCSPSAERSGGLRRVRGALAGSELVVVDDVEPEPTRSTLERGLALLRGRLPGAVVALGGGGPLVAARAVAAVAAEGGDPLKLVTRYGPDGTPTPTRLRAPKPPIVNIPVTPTPAMDRAGAALVDPSLPQRLEFYDHGLRPIAVLWDHELVSATPERVFWTSAAAVLIRALGDLADGDGGDLERLDREGAARFVVDVFREAGPLGLAGRLRLMSAAFIQTRIEDARRRLRPRSAFGGDYAAATALHSELAGVSQGAATAALFASSLASAPPPVAETRRVAELLGVRPPDQGDALFPVVDAVLELLRSRALPTRLRELEIDRAVLPAVAERMRRNVNDPRYAAPDSDPLARLRTAW